MKYTNLTPPLFDIKDLVKWLSEQMPQGPFLFDPNDLSDMPQRQLASEILREKLFINFILRKRIILILQPKKDLLLNLFFLT